ncbi:MAG: type II toxin-antitoxin system Phd/YefM family antitoxin [Galactobacter sp.]
MTTLPLAAARAAFSRLVDAAATTHERFEVTRNGSRAAVVLGADDYDQIMETLDVLGNTELVSAIQESLAGGREADLVSLEDMSALMRESGRTN